ncbi:unnamed protein product [Dibothriocephalus latus]|uniref:Uncharacterized protein n=1 Tax=Dibothriocephalus latus TaxID=60516 RepID=A0A3P6R2S6_DIBLA|nr:unnamed protein product [Dibothriocephalus latus]
MTAPGQQHQQDQNFREIEETYHTSQFLPRLNLAKRKYADVRQ